MLMFWLQEQSDVSFFFDPGDCFLTVVLNDGFTIQFSHRKLKFTIKSDYHILGR